MKFLSELNDALDDALGRYAEEGAEKLEELQYMKKEVKRARRIIAERMEREGSDYKPAYSEDAYREMAYQ